MNYKAIMEAALFASGEPLTYKELSKLLDIDTEKVKKEAESLAADYEGHGIQLLIFEDSCQFCVNDDYSEAVRTALGLRKRPVLSNSSLEVLAVIAYHQPVTKAYVEQIRGSDSSYALNLLIDRGLIVASGKLDVPGKPNLYITTDEFLRCFGLKTLEDLPKLDIFGTDNTGV